MNLLLTLMKMFLLGHISPNKHFYINILKAVFFRQPFFVPLFDITIQYA